MMDENSNPSNKIIPLNYWLGQIIAAAFGIGLGMAMFVFLMWVYGF
jgi:hypothetical protein